MIMRSLATFLALLMALNFWGWQEPYLGLAMGLAWLVLTSWLLGSRIDSFASSPSERILWGLAITAAVVSLTGTILFYLNLYQAVTIAAITALLPWFGTNRRRHQNIKQPEPLTTGKIISWFVSLSYLGAAAITWLIMNAVATPEAIRTPWAVVPPYIFLLVALTSGLCLTLSRSKTNPLWLVPIYLVFLTLLLAIYPLGYGFDPFIHQASEKILAATGTISPKPLYYLGQYTLVTFLAQNLNLAIEQIDAWLVPILASLILPVAIFGFVKHLKIERPWPWLLTLAPLAFTLSAFTYTTPQGLAYLWVLAAALLLAGRKLKANVPASLLWFTGFAALVTHPLAGLPIIGILALWWLGDYGHNLKKPRRWYWLTAGITALIVPLSFTLISWLRPSSASITFSLNILPNLARLSNDILAHLPFLPRFIDLPDAVYLWGRPLTLIFLILATIGWWQAKNELKALRFIGWVASLPLLGYLILAIFTYFPNLPANEQNFYSIRLWDITLLMLWPLALLGAFAAGKIIINRCRYSLTWIIAGSLLLTASFYLTYPRLDVWHRDTAYNTTPFDLAAVRLVEAKSAGAPYVVLANQAVAAAAVKEFGFAKYYNGHFYYPLPTGTNPLYQVYLNAAERGLPTRDIIKKAAELGVSQVFLVLNRYWADYDVLSQTAKTEADAWWKLAEGRITVYRYDF